MNRDVEIKMDQQLVQRIRRTVNDFGKVLIDFREVEGMTLDELADRIGCSASYIFRVERGTRIIPINTRVLILKKGLSWTQSEIELYLIETVKKYEQKKG